MSGSDSLHFEILARVARQLEHLGSQVLQDGRAVDSGGGANPAVAAVISIKAPSYEQYHLPLAKLLLFKCLWILPTGN